MRPDASKLMVEDLSSEQRELLKLLLEQEGVDVAESLVIPRRAPGESVPLSYSQRRLWFTDQIATRTGDQSPNSNPIGWRLFGDLDAAALEESFGELARRHEILRTRFIVKNGEPVQVVEPPALFILPTIDLRHLPSTEREAEVARLAAEIAGHRFDLERGPLLRATLVRLDDREHVLILTVHCLVADGMSEGILLEELSALYQSLVTDSTSPLAELQVQYADFALWQREWLMGEARQQQLTYWKKQLAGSAPYLRLPTDRQRPADPTFGGAWLPFALPADLSARVRSASRREGVTTFMLFLAAWKTLLWHYTGQEDIVVATTVSNRGRPEAERLLGFFSNNLLLRTSLSDNLTFRDLLQRVRDVAIGAYGHQDLPFEELIRELYLDPDFGDVPHLQNVLVLHERSAERSLTLPGIVVEKLPSRKETATFDLAVRLVDGDDAFAGSVEYSTDLYEAVTVRRTLEHFEAVLTYFVDDCDRRISELSLASDRPQQDGLLSGVADNAGYDQGTAAERYLCAGSSFDAGRECLVVAARDDLERRLVALWEDVLGVSPVGVTDDFFDLGGKSRDALRLFAAIDEACGIALPLGTLFQAPTIERCADILAEMLGLARPPTAGNGAGDVLQNASGPVVLNGPVMSAASGALAPSMNGRASVAEIGSWSPLVRIQPSGTRLPFFCVHGAGGGVLTFRDLARRLGTDQPFYGFQAQGVDGQRRPLERIEDMASQYLEHVRAIQPRGPYLLGGYSGGGVIAFEMAQQLLRMGEGTALLVLLDTFHPHFRMRRLTVQDRIHNLSDQGFTYVFGWPRRVRDRRAARSRLTEATSYVERGLRVPYELREALMEHNFRLAQARYQPRPYPGTIALFRAADISPEIDHAGPTLGWSGLASDEIEVHEIPGSHHTLVLEPNVRMLVDRLKTCLEQAQQRAAGHAVGAGIAADPRAS